MTQEGQNILFELITLNSLRAVHKRKVSENLYARQDAYYRGEQVDGTIEDLIALQQSESNILAFEQRLAPKVTTEELPDWLTVKQYAEFLGVSTSKVYREIKKGNILADKVKGRWHIFVQPRLIEEAAN